jgi:hypothetical protein
MPIVSNQTLNAAALSCADQLNLSAVAYKAIRPDVNDSPRAYALPSRSWPSRQS